MRAVGRLADAAHTRENIGVRHAPRLDGVRERLRHVLLPDDFAERLRAIFSRDDFVAHMQDFRQRARRLVSRVPCGNARGEEELRVLRGTRS